MDELIFDVSTDEDGRYVAVARSNGIATDGATLQELKVQVRDLVGVFYADAERPANVRLIYDQVLAVA